jgi:hypothetical protein
MTRHAFPLLCTLCAGPVLAHITPPVTLTSEREAVSLLLPGAKRYFVREVRLTGNERDSIRQQTGWTPDEEFYRFYLGRDEEGRDRGAVGFLSDFTIHGPLRIAVGMAPDGRIRGAKVIEVTEETYPWVKSLLDRRFMDQFAGDARGAARRASSARDGSMARFYGDIIRDLVHREAVRRRVAPPQETNARPAVATRHYAAAAGGEC